MRFLSTLLGVQQMKERAERMKENGGVNNNNNNNNSTNTESTSNTSTSSNAAPSSSGRQDDSSVGKCQYIIYSYQYSCIYIILSAIIRLIALT